MSQDSESISDSFSAQGPNFRYRFTNYVSENVRLDFRFYGQWVWRWLSAQTFRCVVWWKLRVVSYVLTASITRTSLKRRSVPRKLHGSISQKTANVWKLQVKCSYWFTPVSRFVTTDICNSIFQNFWLSKLHKLNTQFKYIVLCILFSPLIIDN
jgi:hypothetical protein